MDEKGQVSIEYLFMVTVSIILISITSSVVLGLGKLNKININLINDTATDNGGLKNEMIKGWLNATTTG